MAACQNDTRSVHIGTRPTLGQQTIAFSHQKNSRKYLFSEQDVTFSCSTAFWYPAIN